MYLNFLVDDGCTKKCTVTDRCYNLKGKNNGNSCLQVLDYFHCKAHMHDFAEKYFGKARKEANHWVDKIMDWLKEDLSKEVLQELKTLLVKNESIAQTRDQLYQ
ncbi:MAG: hypothetical protein AAF600_11355 [Bacteroidota bacterium]